MPRVIISEPGNSPQPYRFDIDSKKVQIGRGSENDIIISCRSVSTRHCNMERLKGGYVLRDKGSTNGIKLDDTLMEVIDLKDGMEVLIGDVLLEFELSEEEIETLEDEDFTPQQKKKLPSIDDDGDVSDKPKSKSKPKPGKKESDHKQTKRRKSDRDKSRDDDDGQTGNKETESAELKPAASKPSAARPYSYQAQPSAHHGGSSWKTLLVFVLVIASVFAGMSWRHKIRTGESLPAKLMNWLNGNPQAAEPEAESNPEGKSTPESNATHAGQDSQEGSGDGITNEDNADDLINDFVIRMNIIISTLVNTKDAASAQQAADQLKNGCDTLTALVERLDKLDTPDDEHLVRIRARMSAVNNANAEKVQKFMPIMLNNEEISTILGPALEDFEDKMSKHDDVFERFGMKQEVEAEEQ